MDNINKDSIFKRKADTSSVFVYELFDNPVIQQISTPKESKLFFKNHQLIPYGGSTEDAHQSILDFLFTLRTLSPSHGSCIDFFKPYCFSPGLSIGTFKSSIFKLDSANDIIDPDTQDAYATFVESIHLNKVDLLSFSSELFDNFKTCGNAYYLVRAIESMGVFSYHMDVLHPKRCFYKVKDPDHIYVTDNDNFSSVKFIYKYPLKPTKFKLGYHYIVHIKDAASTYGTPDSAESIQHQYNEIQQATYQITETSNKFMGTFFLEIEAENPSNFTIDDNKDNTIEEVRTQIKELYSSSSKTVHRGLVLERPFGSEPSQFKSIPANTNEKYFETIAKLNRSMIASSHSISGRLLGDHQPMGLSTGLFMQELSSKVSLFLYYQNLFQIPLSKDIQFFLRLDKAKDLAKLSFRFANPFADINGATIALKPVEDASFI